MTVWKSYRLIKLRFVEVIICFTVINVEVVIVAKGLI